MDEASSTSSLRHAAVLPAYLLLKQLLSMVLSGLRAWAGSLADASADHPGHRRGLWIIERPRQKVSMWPRTDF